MFRTSNDVMIPVKKQHESDDLVYVCDFCSDGWFSETEVELHRASTHKKDIKALMQSDNKNLCKMCVKSFVDEESVLKHIKSDHLLSSETAIRVEREIFICDTCEEIFFNKLLLTHHITIHSHRNRRSTKIKCPTCFKKIRLSNCWYHFRAHSLQSIVCCRICCVKFNNRLQLSEHLKCHPHLYKCELCGYTTKKGDLFNSHIVTVHKRQVTSVSAMQDDVKLLKFYRPHRYPSVWKKYNMMGWRGVRLTNYVHICVLCREICTTIESMVKHILVDHLDKQLTVTNHMCSCGMEFTNKVLLKYHMLKFKHET